MGNAIDFRLETLATPVAAPESLTADVVAAPSQVTAGARGTFYLETFGCQMNEHDSEKVAGLLLARGYQQVETAEAAEPDPLQHLQHPRKSGAESVFATGRIPRTEGRRKEDCGARLRGAAGGRRHLYARAVGQSGVRLGELPQTAGVAGARWKPASSASPGSTTTPTKRSKRK